MKKLQKGFTLVELIVVVSILAILATIGFVSYSGYITSVRDTNRITQLSSLYDGLELYKVKRSLPIPEDKIDIEASGSLIAYQGYMGKSNLEIIEYSKEGKDPKDDVYFSYYLTENKKYFQLMAFLEDEESFSTATSFKPLIPQTYAAIDYSNRYPYVLGKKLGMLTNENNIPIQEISSIQTAKKLDIATTTGTYLSHFRPNQYASGTGVILYMLEEVAEVGGKFCEITETKIIYCKSEYFVSTWKTDNSGVSGNNQITLPLLGTGDYDFVIDWGDGSSSIINSWDDSDKTHTYSSAGNYTIKISGTIEGFAFQNGGDKEKILEISSWGPFKFGNSGRYFYGASNLTITATDIPNLSATTDMSYAFYNASSLITIPNMNSWDTSDIIDMRSMFYNASNFNQDLSSWDVSSVLYNNCFAQGATSWDLPKPLDFRHPPQCML